MKSSVIRLLVTLILALVPTLASAYYDPAQGRWCSRDPMGENFPTREYNPYAFINNNTPYHYDVLGLFGGGGWATPRDSEKNARGDREDGKIWFNGHGDFANLDVCPFDYELEDNDPFSGPILNPGNHFQPMTPEEGRAAGVSNPATMGQIETAITECDPDAFQRAMHRGQDYFVHFSKGYRWDYTRIGDMKLWIPQSQDGKSDKGRWGHIKNTLNPSMPNPDHDNDAWDLANQWTMKQLDKWNNGCCRECCDGCDWVPRSSGRCGDCPAPQIHKMGRQITDARKKAEREAAARRGSIRPTPVR